MLTFAFGIEVRAALVQEEGMFRDLLPYAFLWVFLADAGLWQFWWITTVRGWSEVKRFIYLP